MKGAERNQNESERRQGEISSTEDDARFAQYLQDGVEDANDDVTSDQSSIEISISPPQPKRRGRPTGSKTKLRCTDLNCRKHRHGERYAPCISLSSRQMNVGENSGASTRSANRNRASSPANNTRMQQDVGQIKHHKRSRKRRKKNYKNGGDDDEDCEGSSKGSVGSSDEERSTSSSESRSSSVSRESRGECSVYDEDDDDERGRTRSGRNYVAKETIIQQQIIEIRRLKENLEAYKEDLRNKSTKLQTSDEEREELIKEITAVVAQKSAYIKNLEDEVEEMKALVKEAEQKMKVFVKEAAGLSDQLKTWKRANAVRAAAQQRRRNSAARVADATMMESNRDDDSGEKGGSGGFKGKGDEEEEEEEEVSKQSVHHIVKEMLGALSNGANGIKSSGARILSSFLNNKIVSSLLDSVISDNSKGSSTVKQMKINERIISRLKKSIQTLKCRTSSLQDWHAYSSILSAITPSNENSWEFSATLETLELRSKKALQKAVERRSKSILSLEEDESIDACGEESEWFQSKRKTRQDALIEKDPELAKTVVSFWLSNTEASPYLGDIKNKHDRSNRNGHGLFCVTCDKQRCECLFTQHAARRCEGCNEAAALCAQNSPQLCLACAAVENECSCEGGFVAGGCGSLCMDCNCQHSECKCEGGFRLPKQIKVCLNAHCRKPIDQCACAKLKRRTFCLCLMCKNRRIEDVRSPENGGFCQCETFSSNCELEQPLQIQHKSDDEIYDLLELSIPGVHDRISKTAFVALKPWYVSRPNKRSCTCVYHTEMKFTMEDAKVACSLLHENCGTQGGCNCSYCEGGGCKADIKRVFESPSSLAKAVLHVEDEESITGHHWACAKGVCHQDASGCGWYKYKEVQLFRSVASKIELDPTTMTVVADQQPVVAAALQAAGVPAGSRAMLVKGSEDNDDRVRTLTSSSFKEETKPRSGDSDEATRCTIRFDLPEFRDELQFARCPLFKDESRDNFRRRVFGKVKQRRAHPKHRADGTVEHYREVQAILETEATAKEILHDSLPLISASFFYHRFVAHHQASMFDRCIDNLPLNSIAILLDFSMNYSHEHQDATQSEWWSAHQSTILPIVVYYRTEDGKVVQARSHIYISSDQNHSNAFVQHCLQELISEYVKEFNNCDGRPPLEHIFLWSDGCAAQFKNKNQFYYIVDFKVTEEGENDKKIRVSHHFFQSCHGKGPSDSEGAVVKSCLHDGEFLYDKYFADTEAAYKYLISSSGRVIHDKESSENEQERKAQRARKNRHTISRRTFHLVPDDAVDHYGLPVVTKVDGSSSCYYFDGAKGRYAENRPPILVYGELSHFCSSCFAGNLDDCDSTSKDGYFVHEITMTREDGRGVAASRAAAQNERVARGKKLIEGAEVGNWVCVLIQDMNHDGGMSEREKEQGGNLAPYEIIDPTPVQGAATAQRDNSQLWYVRVHERCECKAMASKYWLASIETCSEGNCDRTTCAKRHETRVPIDLILTAPFEMNPNELARRNPRRSAASSSSSSSRAGYTYILSPGIVQAAKSTISHDLHKYGADCI